MQLRRSGKTLLAMQGIQQEFMEKAYKELMSSSCCYYSHRKLPRPLRGMQYDYVLVDEYAKYVHPLYIERDSEALSQQVKEATLCSIQLN